LNAALDGGADLGHNERLSEQVGKPIDDFRRGGLCARHDNADRLEGEGAGEDR
jgi:hypothetical protein